ncbi:head-tail connector protein [Mixta mediterraneensis]|uniref:head-tail connector protein n=1 Tax=Mixta mediterraneensis TaxID=2758443 RepID=UPI001876CE9D|nr:head-tail connector protein [Mixta mediterraneensis]MBE5251732.1 phage gp6-like head-tail connector protein [Mixta mediterraneensis]
MELIKKHLRVDSSDEDDLIAGYAQASVDFVEHYCDGTLVVELTPPVENEEPLREVLFSSGIWQAMLLLIGQYYANREASGQSQAEIPFGVEALLYRHRKWH